MNDTSEHFAQKQFDILYAKTAKERFRMAVEMSEFGHQLVERRIRKANPGLSSSELKVQIFKEYYADSYSDDEFKAIEAAWRAEKAAGTAQEK